MYNKRYWGVFQKMIFVTQTVTQVCYNS